MNEPLNITELEVIGFKKIVAARIDIDSGKPLVLAGTNGAGKSSLIDSIFWALTGKGADKPIHEGALKAKVTLKLEGKDRTFLVERQVTAKGGASLKVTDENDSGAQVPKAQTFLDSLFAAYAIDPLAFLGMKPPAQAKALKEITGLGPIIDKLDAEEKTLMDERKLVNRDVSSLESRLDAIKVPTGQIPDEEIDIAGLTKELSMIEVTKRDLFAEKQRYDSLWNDYSKVSRLVTELETQLARAKADADAVFQRAQEQKPISEAAVESIEKIEARTQQIQSDIASASDTNAAVRAKMSRRQIGKELSEATAKANDLTKKIEDIRERKATAISEAKLPVNGLEFTDDGLIFDGLPLGDLNTAKQIEVCCAIAMAEKPDLRIINVKEAALISRENFRILCEIAQAQGYHVIAEHFSETPIDGALFIQDGEIQA